MGDFILTGSSQFDLVQHITQSLAGRVGRVELLPLQGKELQQAAYSGPNRPVILAETIH